MSKDFHVIGCPVSEFLYVLFKDGRIRGVPVKAGYPVNFNNYWASFVDNRDRQWDVAMDNISAVVHKKVR